MSSEDGPGLRTTAFFKGCPLSCVWCHNPESISSKPEVIWHSARCFGCASCVSECAQQGLSFRPEGLGLQVDRAKCLACFECSNACPTGAIEGKGSLIEPAVLCQELLRDRAYWGEDGGVTLSGGEALLQPETLDLLRELKHNGIQTAVDTCGFINSEQLLAALEYTDIVLYDLKLADSAAHKQFTGVSNELIMENFGHVANWTARSAAPRLWIRTPIIPGYTDSQDNILALGKIIGTVLASGARVERWELAAFNNLCVSKYLSLGLLWQLRDLPLIKKSDSATLLTAAKEASGLLDVYVTGALRRED
jgi:pyruvate formate lyase activating enzyme